MMTIDDDDYRNYETEANGIFRTDGLGLSYFFRQRLTQYQRFFELMSYRLTELHDYCIAWGAEIGSVDDK